jgi:hypothetical protein
VRRFNEGYVSDGSCPRNKTGKSKICINLSCFKFFTNVPYLLKNCPTFLVVSTVTILTVKRQAINQIFNSNVIIAFGLRYEFIKHLTASFSMIQKWLHCQIISNGINSILAKINSVSWREFMSS